MGVPWAGQGADWRAAPGRDQRGTPITLGPARTHGHACWRGQASRRALPSARRARNQAAHLFGGVQVQVAGRRVAVQGGGLLSCQVTARQSSGVVLQCTSVLAALEGLVAVHPVLAQRSGRRGRRGLAGHGAGIPADDMLQIEAPGLGGGCLLGLVCIAGRVTRQLLVL